MSVLFSKKIPVLLIEKMHFVKKHLIHIIPLRAKQVSEANLRSEQGGINYTPFVLSLPYAKKKKKKISHINGGQLKNVCLSVVCCLSVTTSSPIIFCTVGLIGLIFFYKK